MVFTPWFRAVILSENSGHANSLATRLPRPEDVWLHDVKISGCHGRATVKGLNNIFPEANKMDIRPESFMCVCPLPENHTA